MAETSRQVIVITGVTKGLGRALAEGFAGLGHTVIGCGRSAEEIERLRRNPGAPHDFDVVDVTREDQVKDWAQRTLARHGAPDLLREQRRRDQPQRAAVGGPRRRVRPRGRREPQGRRQRAPPLRAGDDRPRLGRDRQPQLGLGPGHGPEVAPYCAPKWAIEGLTRALAQELPPGLAAVPLNPGIVDTDMLRSCFGDKGQALPRPRGNGRRPPCRSCSSSGPRTTASRSRCLGNDLRGWRKLHSVGLVRLTNGGSCPGPRWVKSCRVRCADRPNAVRNTLISRIFRQGPHSGPCNSGAQPPLWEHEPSTARSDGPRSTGMRHMASANVSSRSRGFWTEPKADQVTAGRGSPSASPTTAATTCRPE